MTLDASPLRLDSPKQGLPDSHVSITRIGDHTDVSQFRNLPPPLGVSNFEELNSIALIFAIAVDPPSIPSFCCNDDTHGEHYEGSSGCCMSSQRDRLVVGDSEASIGEEFVRKSMGRPSPLSEAPATPSDVRRSINYLSSNSPDEIRAFRKRQMGHLRSLIAGREYRSRAWDA